jgi:GR25 family glycosyltransferase involved in LPS biosynthesis
LTSISFYIISVKNSRNCDDLVKSLIHNFGISPVISWGVTPSDLPCSYSSPHLHKGEYRSLSCNEVAAALSHSRARELAFAEGKEWSIFLEDDSELLQDNNSDLIESLLKLPTDFPFFVHLFPEQNGILTRSRYPGISSIWKIPDYANAYALNTEGLKFLLKKTNQTHLYLADWPKFPPGIKRVATSRSIFRHPPQSIDSSLISDERKSILANSRAFTYKYRLNQAIFRFSRIPFNKFGSEKIANESLRSVTWW